MHFAWRGPSGRSQLPQAMHADRRLAVCLAVHEVEQLDPLEQVLLGEPRFLLQQRPHRHAHQREPVEPLVGRGGFAVGLARLGAGAGGVAAGAGRRLRAWIMCEWREPKSRESSMGEP